MLFQVPPSSFEGETDTTVNMNDLFQQGSSVNELDEIARDEFGKLKKLTPEQLRELRETGRFSVPSVHFEGHSHEWELSRFLQMGKKNVSNAFHNELAIALNQIIIQIPERVYGNTKSYQ